MSRLYSWCQISINHIYISAHNIFNDGWNRFACCHRSAIDHASSRRRSFVPIKANLRPPIALSFVSKCRSRYFHICCPSHQTTPTNTQLIRYTFHCFIKATLVLKPNKTAIFPSLAAFDLLMSCKVAVDYSLLTKKMVFARSPFSLNPR